MIYGISENITMMALTVITMYKDVITGENKLVKISHKKDDNIKIVSDITYNLDLINSMIIDLRKYNEELNDTIKKNNLHAKTLHENIEFVCGHVELEYKKHTNDIQKALEYFMQYTEKIIEQNEYMILLKFVS
jgi:Rps23 Pro-64 3,4-dihydroxylase Tpa1-like proline 4-hydroxylase